MNFKEIQNFIKKKDYLFSEHADEERTKDQLIVEDVETVILSGDVVEERLNDPRGESRLIAGKTKDGRLVHVVVGLRAEKPVIVTVYVPKITEWIRGIIKKRKKYE